MKAVVIVPTVDLVVKAAADAVKAAVTVDRVAMAAVIADPEAAVAVTAAATVAHAPSVQKAEKAAATPTTFLRS